MVPAPPNNKCKKGGNFFFLQNITNINSVKASLIRSVVIINAWLHHQRLVISHTQQGGMCTSSISGVQRLPPYGERPARKVGQGTQRQSLQALVGLGKSWDVINYIRPRPTSACPGARDRAGHPFFCTTVDFDGEGNRYWATLLCV